MAKQVMDIKASKGMTATLSDEIKRDWSDKEWAAACERKGANYDRNRTHLNFEVTTGGKIVPVDTSRTIVRKMADNLASRGITDPNAGLAEPKYRTVVNIVLGGSRSVMAQLAFGEQPLDITNKTDNSHLQRQPEIEQWAQDMYRFACDRWGEQNVLNFTVHLDETNAHAHLTLLPIDERGKFAYKRMFAGKDIFEYKRRMSELHDALAVVNKRWGLDRGDSVAETKAKHRSSEEYRRELSLLCSTLEDQVEQDRKTLADIRHEIWLGERRVNGLTAMVDNLEDKKSAMEVQMQELAARIKSGDENVHDLQQQIDRLGIDLQRVTDQLDDKNDKLDLARHTLSELKAQESEARDKVTRESAVLSDMTANKEQQFRYRLAEASVSIIADEFRNVLPHLDISAQEILDGTFLNDLAAQADALTRCGVLLLIQQIDLATRFAKGHGGGGSGSDLPWGRKDDEDDRAWARRCMMMAHRMMRPSSAKSIKRK